MTLGQLVAMARRRAHLTQRELASWIIKQDGRPISPRYVSDIERGRRKAPSPFLVDQFGTVLDLPREELLRHAGGKLSRRRASST